MSTETVPVVQHWMRKSTECMRLACDDILALKDSMTYADRVDLRDETAVSTGWRRHWYRVLKQHQDAGWNITEAWADWQQYDRVMTMLIAMINEHLGMTVPDRGDPKPKEERVLKPGEMTNSQKAAWWVSGIWAGLMVVAMIVNNLVSQYPTFAAPMFAIGWVFWAVMTAWWVFAGEYEKTHPDFAAARLAVGSAGAAVIAKKAYDAQHGASERLQNGGYSIKTPGIDPTAEYRRVQEASLARTRELEEEARVRAQETGGRGDFNTPSGWHHG